MLYEVMLYLRNFFAVKEYEGTFTIEQGIIDLPFLVEGQYFLVKGSIFNDGVYKYGTDTLTDEKFDGTITELRPPRAFLDIVEEIKDYNAKDTNSAYTSESFGGYSYTKATDASGNVASWKNVFANKLYVWRKK